jgi:hypothetical protein
MRLYLKNGEDQIAECIDDHFDRLADFAKTVARISPSVGRDALTALERERDAAAERLTEAYAKTNAAHQLWHQASAAEEAALMEICAYRCSPGELEQKFRYLATYQDELSDEQREALFASFLPGGEA